MSALAHHIEGQGVATAAISLIREHTEVIRPPRALWVPFELGRPFGPPGHPEFQRDVLRALLATLEAESGPVLEDYPYDAPVAADDEGPWACPLPLPAPPPPGSPAEEFARQVLDEVAALRPWYNESCRTRRTLAVNSGLEPEDAAELILALSRGETPDEPADARAPFPALIRFAADDLKAFAFEAVIARPSTAPPQGAELNQWLFNETAMGEALHQVRERFVDAEDPAWKALARTIVPAALIRQPPQ